MRWSFPTFQSFPLQALLPIANIPAIEYTLQFLSQQEGLTEIVLFSAKHVTELRAYLNNSRWRANIVQTGTKSGADGVDGSGSEGTAKAPAVVASPKIRVVTSVGVHSAGDAMRAVDTMGFIRSETFILVDGPAVISNASLAQALAGHNARNKVDTNAIMTMVLKKAYNTPAAASGSGSTSCGVGIRGNLKTLTRIALNPIDGKVHGYDILPASDALASVDGKALTAVTAKVAKADPAAIATVDLIDTRVYLCSLTVLVHFSDNYDYQTVREAYIHNETLNVDMGFRFNAHLLAADAYMATVTDLSSYTAVNTRDVLKGWSYPLVPSTNWAEDAALAACGDASVAHLSNPWTAKGTVLFQKGSVVDPTAKLARDVIVAAGAHVGAGAQIGSGVVVGPGAHIGEGAIVGANTVILAGAVLGKKAHVAGSTIIGAKASVGEGVVIGEGCVLGHGVVVAAGKKVEAHSRFTTVAEDASTREWPSQDEFEEDADDEDDSDDDDSSDDDGKKKKTASSASAGSSSFTAGLYTGASSALTSVSKAHSAYKAALRDYYYQQTTGTAASSSELALASSLVALVDAVQVALKNRLLTSSPANALSLFDALLLPRLFLWQRRRKKSRRARKVVPPRSLLLVPPRRLALLPQAVAIVSLLALRTSLHPALSQPRRTCVT
jgi:translation initiation factor eIF-2B subunit epsilon